MSVINFMNYSLSTAAEGFVPSHAPLKNNKHLNIPFQSTQPRRGKNKSASQGLTPLSWVRGCGTRRGSWGRASILSVMPNAAPNSQHTFSPLGYVYGCRYICTCRGWGGRVEGRTRGQENADLQLLISFLSPAMTPTFHHSCHL